MGKVYSAIDTRLDRRVAVKRLVGPHTDRFRREAHAIAALNHPNVCTLYDIGADYLVMEYLEGRPLNGPVPPKAAVQYAVQICDALEAAHKRGIVHRDLKPANILLTGAGIKLLDFGLASDVQGASNETRAALTEAGTILGTAAYMSPEQAEGRRVDHRSDLFSLGVIIYELLTGSCPFLRETTMGTIAAILRDDPAPLSPPIPSVLRSIVEKCLEKESSRRYIVRIRVGRRARRRPVRRSRACGFTRDSAARESEQQRRGPVFRRRAHPRAHPCPIARRWPEGRWPERSVSLQGRRLRHQGCRTEPWGSARTRRGRSRCR